MVQWDKIISETETKLRNSIHETEYCSLEKIPPDPKSPSSALTHERMVQLGLVSKAHSHERENRYCNLFPFDDFIVDIGDYYINASWIRNPEINNRKSILTMGPLGPSVQEDNKEVSSFDFNHLTDFGEDTSKGLFIFMD